ncbi:MAG: M48 family metallopeptidase [Candidatus Omnitrophica bacterium]|jgi:predicted Zn-dependent protease|nr:M48 family metallopeptidase [Candidatus Omnitrophota bacterium]MDD5660517.1 M48 family metallopeptidase [Candidatus Omnitrophota bacterium]
MRLSIVLVFFIVFLSGCTSVYNPATGQHETLLIDTQTEVSLGEDMAEQINSEVKLLTSHKMRERLERIAGRISAVSDRKDISYKFNIVENKEFNAFAIPGGIVYVHSGLLEEANDDELAAVLGHEVGHIAARHSVKRLQAVLGYQLITSIALGASGQKQVLQAVDVVFNVVVLGYSRKDEYLADKLGVKYAKAAGFNPQGMVTFFRKLEKEGGDTGINLVFLSSHPPIEERIKQAEKEIAALNQ